MFGKSSEIGVTNAALTLHVYPKNILGRTIKVTDATKKNTLFKIDVRNRKPHMTFHASSGPNSSGSGTAVLATASLHMLRRIEIDIKGAHIAIPITHSWSNTEFAYASPALGGARVAWTSKSLFAQGGIVCLDGAGAPLAKFCQKYGVGKYGLVEFADGRVLDPALVEELAVVALCVAEYRLVQSGAVSAAIA